MEKVKMLYFLGLGEEKIFKAILGLANYESYIVDYVEEYPAGYYRAELVIRKKVANEFDMRVFNKIRLAFPDQRKAMIED